MESLYIIAHCFNDFATIDQTLYSVFKQHSNLFIYYHVQDGGSSDGTQEKLKRFSDKVKKSNLGNKFVFSWDSRPDKRMYHAINLAVEHLNIPQESFMGWINADDLLCEGCFDHLSQVTDAFPHIHWLGGKPFVMDMAGNVLSQGQSAWYGQQLLQHGLCDGVHWPYVQQEGTFWRKALWDAAGGLNPNVRLAGDWDLWRRMAQHTSYVQLPWHMGIFRKRPGQLSQDISAYTAEISSILPLKLRRKALRKLFPVLDSLTATSVTISGSGKLELNEVPLAPNIKMKIRMLLLSFGLYSLIAFIQNILRTLKGYNGK